MLCSRVRAIMMDIGGILSVNRNSMFQISSNSKLLDKTIITGAEILGKI